VSPLLVFARADGVSFFFSSAPDFVVLASMLLFLLTARSPPLTKEFSPGITFTSTVFRIARDCFGPPCEDSSPTSLAVYTQLAQFRLLPFSLVFAPEVSPVTRSGTGGVDFLSLPTCQLLAPPE